MKTTFKSKWLCKLSKSNNKDNIAKTVEILQVGSFEKTTIIAECEQKYMDKRISSVMEVDKISNAKLSEPTWYCSTLHRALPKPSKYASSIIHSKRAIVSSVRIRIHQVANFHRT